MNSKILSRIRQSVWIFAIPLFFCLVLFREAIFSVETLFHMDWAPYFPRSNWIGPWQHFVVNHAPFSLMHLMKAFLPLRFYHVAFYIVAISGTTWALTAYLRDRGLAKGSALLGGMAFGFSGYCVSLVSAGHRGVFEACLSAAVLLFVGSRAIRRGTWYYYVFSALAIALVIGTQPDVFLILMMVAGPLLLVDLVQEWRAKRDGCIKKLSLGVLIFAVAMGVFGWRGVQKILTQYLPNREASIEQAGNTGDAKEEKWIFCTNWSLPPSDCVELAVPLVLGVESTDGDVPFWGELGRSFQWEPGQSGFPSYRQHTVYAGGIQLALAFYVLILLFRRADVFKSHDRTLLMVSSALVVATFILALGRYTPFYRLFYALPLASAIRCPVKFLHAVNLAGAVLCAFGGQALMMRFNRKESSKGAVALVREPEGLALLAVGCVFIGLLAALVFFGGGTEFLEQTWSSLGYDARIQKNLLERLNSSLVHTMLVFGFIGFLFFFALRRRCVSWAKWVPWACALAVAIDMTVVNAHYVNTVDLSVHEMDNVIAEDILRGKDGKPRVLELMTGFNKHHPVRANLTGYYSQDIVMVGQEQRKNRKFFAALQQGGETLRRAMTDFQVEFIIAPVKFSAALSTMEGVRITEYYGFDGLRFVRVSADQASVILLTTRLHQ